MCYVLAMALAIVNSSVKIIKLSLFCVIIVSIFYILILGSVTGTSFNIQQSQAIEEQTTLGHSTLISHMSRLIAQADMKYVDDVC